MTRQTAQPRRPVPVARLVLFALAGWLVAANFKDVVWYNLFPKRLAAVSEGEIYRSGMLTTAALTWVVREHDIKTVIDLGAWVEPTEKNRRANAREQETAESLGVTRHVFTLSGDSTGDPAQYAEALRLVMDPANHPVLVHCGAGTERTGCLVALYRMHKDGWTLDQAFAEADEAGHSPRRNPKLRETLETQGPGILAEVEREEPDG